MFRLAALTQFYLPIRVRFVCAAFGASIFIPVCVAQMSPEQTLQTLRPAPGFDVSLFASEPMITNPTAIDVDARGRVWVCEGKYYRRAAKDPGVDKIKVLEDVDGDGKADRSTVFADGLLVPMSVCVAGTKVFVGESPYLFVYEDKDGDLKADPGSKKVLLEGFGGRNHDHGLHGLVVGPDHKLYMTHGDSGFDVTGPDGSRIRYRWGAMIRCNLDGTDLELVAVNFRNPYELAVDSFGNVWCSDNDRDGLRSVRICWVLEGGNCGWYGHPLDRREPDGSYDPRYHWRTDTLGHVPYVLATGFGSPCGMSVYESGLFGAAYRNQFFHAEAGPRELRCYRVAKQGAGFQATTENVLTTEGDDYYRPVDVCTAPDGAMYVADWYDGGVGGHAYNNPDQGRIYRLRPKGRMPQKLVKRPPYQSVPDAIEGLKSPNGATRVWAQQRLVAADTTALRDLTELSQDPDPIYRARALWMLDAIGPAGRRIVAAHLENADPSFRALAVRILRRHGSEALPSLLALADDDDAEVRRELLLALRGQSGFQVDETLHQLIAAWDGTDRFYLEAINVAAEGKRKAVYDRVLKSNDHFDSRKIGLLRILDPKRAGEYLGRALTSGELNEASTLRIVEALAKTEPLSAGRALLNLLAEDRSAKVQQAVLSALREKLPHAWRGLRSDETWVKVLVRALGEERLLPTALAVAGQVALPALTPHVRAVVESSDTDESDRVLAVGVLAKISGPEEIATFQRLLDPDSAASLRTAAIQALVTHRRFAALRGVLLDGDRPTELKAQIIERLGHESDGCFFLLPLVDQEKLAPALAQQVIRIGTGHPDTNVRLLYNKFIPESDRPKTLGDTIEPSEILALAGDSDRGRDIFYRGSVQCATCHRVGQWGQDIGPDLTQIGSKYDRSTLLDTILFPSKAIAPEFVPYIIQTDSHGVVAAFIVRETDNAIVVKTERGARLKIARDDIIEMAKQETSLMPELLLGGLTVQDAADLLAFLESLKPDEAPTSN